MTTNKLKGSFAISHLNLTAWVASGVLLVLSAGVAPAQTAEDVRVSAPPGANQLLTLNPTSEASPGEDESSNSLEFTAPASSIMTAPVLAENGSMSLANPEGSLLSSSRIQLPAGSSAIALGASQANPSRAATTAFIGGLLAGVLLVVGVVGTRLVRERSGSLN